MFNTYEIVKQITSCTSLNSESIKLLNKFAEGFGWKPSDYFEFPETAEFSTLHLVVEHGLENTAVVSFLRSPYFKYGSLNYNQRIKLLSLSYNNLVDWHFPIGESEATIINNRINIVNDKEIVQNYSLSSMNYDFLRSEVFEQAIEKRVNPNVPTLDDALIKTISIWKRKLSAELDYKVSVVELSALFNCIILARAVEDDYRRIARAESAVVLTSDTQMLVDYIERGNEYSLISSIIRQVITDLVGSDEIPGYLIDENKLQVFNSLSKNSLYSLFSDFYRWSGIPYKYDFSVMSKHALSRIYEHYVSILKVVETPESNQPSLFSTNSFNPLPVEEKRKAMGSVYTPQFIARFFAKFFKKDAYDFSSATITDPACGSGMFLRTCLELRFEDSTATAKKRGTSLTEDEIKLLIESVQGFDYDPNAINATRLSLALLYLAFVGKFPSKIEAFEMEVLEAFQRGQIPENSRRLMIANPPFVNRESQYPAIRERIDSLMSRYAKGKVDMYQAFLMVGIKIIAPGGYGMFVLPHSFLIADSAKGIRRILSEETWILCLVDLSEIKVFGDKGIYSILIIFQKKTQTNENPPAIIAKCRDLVGKTLQAVLDRRLDENYAYSVYETEQKTFSDEVWTILPPSQMRLKSLYNELPKLEEFMHVRQGFVSGIDKVFIISHEQYNKFPRKEREIFTPYLRDKEMRSYDIAPQKDLHYFFYPYVRDKSINENELKTRFPKVYEYLMCNSF